MYLLLLRRRKVDAKLISKDDIIMIGFEFKNNIMYITSIIMYKIFMF